MQLNISQYFNPCTNNGPSTVSGCSWQRFLDILSPLPRFYRGNRGFPALPSPCSSLPQSKSTLDQCDFRPAVAYLGAVHRLRNAQGGGLSHVLRFVTGEGGRGYKPALHNTLNVENTLLNKMCLQCSVQCVYWPMQRSCYLFYWHFVLRIRHAI